MKKTLFVLVLLAVSVPAFGQVVLRGSAKFVCGRADAAHINAWAFSPGHYYTTINVTNPSDNPQVVVGGRKRFSVARLAQQPGPFTGWVGWARNAGESMQVDCGDIYAHLAIAPGTFIDGFVHFMGDNPYDVTAVYTVGNGQMVISQDVDRIRIQ